MAFTTINKSTDYFNTVIYTGNGASNRAVTSGFATDFVWIKNRGTTDDHVLFDKIRTGTKYLYSNQTSAEATYSSQEVTFENTGVNVGSYQSINQNSGNIASWHWKANGAGSANTAGSINSTVSANTTNGFSIVSYTGTGSNATVGHGLGVAPSLIITKARTASGRFWGVYSKPLENTGVMALNSTQAFDTSATYWNNTSPTDTLFSVGTNGDTNSASAMIAYCFADVQGFSKTGSYVGTGNADGPFCYTGMKPAFVMAKAVTSGPGWTIIDNKRNPVNPEDKWLYPNGSDAEYDASSYPSDFLSNGFKIRNTGSYFNSSGVKYIYMAFAAAPLVGSNNIPANAR